MADTCSFILDPFTALESHRVLGLSPGDVYGQSRESLLMPDGQCRHILGRPVFNGAGDIVAMECCCTDGSVTTAKPSFDERTGDVYWQGSCPPAEGRCCQCRVLFRTSPCEVPLEVTPEDCDGETTQGPGLLPLCYHRPTDSALIVETTFPETIMCGGVEYMFSFVIQDVCGVVSVVRTRHVGLLVNACEDREPCELSAVAIYEPECIPTQENNFCDNTLTRGDRRACSSICTGSAQVTVLDFGPPTPQDPNQPPPRSDCDSCASRADEFFEQFFRDADFALESEGFTGGDCRWTASDSQEFDTCSWGLAPGGGPVPDTTITVNWLFEIIVQIDYVHLETSRVNVSVHGEISVDWRPVAVPCENTAVHLAKGHTEHLPEVAAVFPSTRAVCAFAKAYASRVYDLVPPGFPDNRRLTLRVELR